MSRKRVEKVLGALEGGYAVTYGSGLAAVSAVMFFLKPQKIYVNEHSGYFGCHDVMVRGHFSKCVLHFFAAPCLCL